MKAQAIDVLRETRELKVVSNLENSKEALDEKILMMVGATVFVSLGITMLVAILMSATFKFSIW